MVERAVSPTRWLDRHEQRKGPRATAHAAETQARVNGAGLSSTTVREHAEVARYSDGMPDPRHDRAITFLQQAASERKLVAIIGTGVSIGLAPGNPALSWTGLVKEGFAYALRKGKITQKQSDYWQSQIDSTEMDELLLAAEFIGGRLGAPNGDLYTRWLDDAFATVRPTQKQMIDAVTILKAAEIPLCTLNYDHLLEDVTQLPPITIDDKRRATAFFRRDVRGILHLHGSFQQPRTCVLGVRDYAITLDSEVRDLLQRTISTFGYLLFIGCGGTFADPNFSNLIRWLRSNLGAAAPEHHALVLDKDVTRCESDPAWHGFVRPVGYGANHDDLPAFIDRCFTNLTTLSSSIAPPDSRLSLDARHAELLSRYRGFLLRDCGEMTIEGVGPDWDTAQRRFEIERLFVPSKLTPFPPEIPRAPDRDDKLAARHRKHERPESFGSAFQEHPRLALLALPGGGKTMLLKRLAVAYADPARRAHSSDGLPDLDLTPVLIRCREWREHIHLPVLSLLDHLHVITGLPDLEGLRDALLPLFRTGRALLLIDGLDEIHDDARRTMFVAHLDTFLREHEHVRVVVTSREAGFDLVAPRVASFCRRYRIAALDEVAIHDLCTHWHRLMSDGSRTAMAEGNRMAELILEKPSLRRLAENPLLLTMLLVVKRGEGRIPPDRVSLYGRAVEVLLDTWNIQGHKPLSLKEAVPQLAYIAFEMMRAGKQTATETELLDYLAEAREKLPRIRLYAKDQPHDFLKRVELRSSLMIEAGHQVELGRITPFYQFRHLTFQEYLAAVAAVEGHYSDHEPGDTVLTPLQPHLLGEEWKEVIPMAAVLAKKAAEPLIMALVEYGRKFVSKTESGARSIPGRGPLPSPIQRLIECLIEEAELSSDNLSLALRSIALLATQEWMTSNECRTLSCGPYGELLLQEAIRQYMSTSWPKAIKLDTLCMHVARWRHERTFDSDPEAYLHLQQLMQSHEPQAIVHGLFGCGGALWGSSQGTEVPVAPLIPTSLRAQVRGHLLSVDPAIWAAATWAWFWIQVRDTDTSPVPAPVLDRFLNLWLDSSQEHLCERAALALTVVRQPRATWTPTLLLAQVSKLRTAAMIRYSTQKLASLTVAFYARNVWSDEELLSLITKTPHINSSQRIGIDFIREELGKLGYFSTMTPDEYEDEDEDWDDDDDDDNDDGEDD